MTSSHLGVPQRDLSTLAAAIKRALPYAGAMLAGTGVAQAQQSEEAGLETVVVSAQKRTESLQDVPLSITAIGNEQLTELKVQDFADYVKFLPNVSYQTGGPGLARPYMRGVASGENANHSGPLPSVGVYLDEQPITTIQGPLDVQIYDIARVEVLAGPQGTLYGASSQAGTIRIITNKPDTKAFDAGVEGSVSTLDGAMGYQGEGFINFPINDKAAIRLVGWYNHTPGYIDNVQSTRVFPVSGIAVDNKRQEANYNDWTKLGVRAALGIDINDSWTITPGVMAQRTHTNGTFGYDPSIGDLKVAHALPDTFEDEWTQASLTLQGKVGNWDMTYAYAWMQRNVDSQSDYSDYSFFYDGPCCQYGAYMYDNDYNLIDPSQFIVGSDQFTKQSHELRFSSPGENRWRVTAGAFYQDQGHSIRQDYQVKNWIDMFEVPGNTDTVWLTDQQRTDIDKALFGELTFDITDKLSVTGGVRFFDSENSLKGFFGYSAVFSGMTGESQCFDPTPFRHAPCINLDKTVSESGNTKRLNFTFHATDDVMLYATWSEGFRPGGINRRGTIPPYKADFLTNIELGFKTTWANNRVRINGALFQEDWDDFQYSFLGQNGLTEIRNAGQARIKGLETDVVWVPVDGLTISVAASWLDAKTTADYCGVTFTADDVGPDDPRVGQPVTDCDDPDAPANTIVQAPKGQELPVQPRFKGNAVVRYEFPMGSMRAHIQGAMVTQTSAWSDLRTAERELLGKQPGYTMGDFAFGLSNDSWGLELWIKNASDQRAVVSRYAQCSTFKPPADENDPYNTTPLCGLQPYNVVNMPRLMGLTFSKNF